MEPDSRRRGHRAARRAQDLGRRYIELLAENLGQPGFRELLLVAHDMDARRDVRVRAAARPAIGSASSARRAAADGGRAAEAFDLAGVGREHVIDALAASLCVPIATDPHLLRFPAEGPVARRDAPRVRSARARSTACSRKCASPAPSR